MSGDLLQKASEALRASAGEADGGRGAETLTRVLHTLRRRERTRRVGRIVVPVAFLLLATSVWAITSGRVPSPLKRDQHRADVGPTARSSRATAGTTPVLEPLPSPEPPPTVPSPLPEALPMIPRSRHPVAAVGREVASTSADDIYGQAHIAHFERGDFAAALSLWDRYLAITPLPPFAVEARFNRAIALLRLGQSDVAAAALRPFVEGDYGSYRRDEARRLLQAIGAD